MAETGLSDIRRRGADPPPRLGELLVSRGALDAVALAGLLRRQAGTGARLGELAVIHGGVSRAAVTEALAEQNRLERVDPRQGAPDPALLPPARMAAALQRRALPWRPSADGRGLVFATPEPERLRREAAALRRDFRLPSDATVQAAICGAQEFDEALQALHPQARAARAAARTPRRLSARGLAALPGRLAAIAASAGLAALAAAHPLQALQIAFAGALALNALNIGLRVAAMALPAPAPPPAPRLLREAGGPELLPTITIIAALYKEPQAAAGLVRALAALDYPPERLDVLLALEEDDEATAAALRAAAPPPWMRLVVTPDGRPRTKPRALNHALDFARGAVVAVYDAEDRPAPDQLRRAAAAFAQAPAQVACLQARLAFDNYADGWIPRCFAIEYISWFHLLLPGFARLGFPLPLGGTSLFVRRRALEKLGAWDAHNVTEDADLGVRLARAGYRTLLLDSETAEEAVRRPLAWIRQRSRWQKGYLATWLTHMRNPLRLYRDLGPAGFWGFQALFLGAAGAFLSQPLLWSAWVWWSLAGGPGWLVWSL
ncbi:MAG: glycosyltransferase, partial [Pseudomonadota bacterium]